MTSLEFIEKEIAMVKKKISMVKSKFTIKGLTYYHINEIKEEINILRDRLQTFQQIKAELEAWYSIKQGIKLCESKMYEDSYYEYLQFEEELFDESESEDAGERLTPIKKALEVEE